MDGNQAKKQPYSAKENRFQAVLEDHAGHPFAQDVGTSRHDEHAGKYQNRWIAQRKRPLKGTNSVGPNGIDQVRSSTMEQDFTVGQHKTDKNGPSGMNPLNL